MREVVTLEWENWRVNKWEERDKGENHRERSQERAKGEYQVNAVNEIKFLSKMPKSSC